MRKVYVETLGEGPDLVLLHGWAMHSGIWERVRSQLAQHFRLHLIDLPGHGASPTPWIHGPDALKNMTEMIVDSLPENSIVCGWSLGGQIAMKLSLDMPERINKLILISTTPSFIQRKEWVWAMEKATLESFIGNLNQDCASTLNRFFTLQIKGDINTISLLRKLRKYIYKEGMPDQDGLQIGMKALLTTDLCRSIKNINHPVILLHGKNDAIVPPDAARWLHDNLQDSKLIMFPDCGHIPFLSHTDQFLSSIFKVTRI
ncbi:MAG: pimeloyl-ACP methyl ester esterase BioH [Burkholderiales bacterium]|jgi:pimeloyl-[acyl-carrier protein] methyl ester esterase